MAPKNPCFEAIYNLMLSEASKPGSAARMPSREALLDVASRLKHFYENKVLTGGIAEQLEFSKRVVQEIDAHRAMLIKSELDRIAAKMGNLEAQQRYITMAAGKPVDYRLGMKMARDHAMGGSTEVRFGGNETAVSKSQAMMSDGNTIMAEMGELQKVAATGVLDKEIGPAMTDLQAGRPVREGTSKEAKKIAETYHRVQKYFEGIKKAVSESFEPIENYIAKRTHDPDKLELVGKQEWVKVADETYGDASYPDMTLEQRTEVFENMFDEIVEGRSKALDFDFEAGERDLYKSLRKHRALIANSPELEMAYREKFSRGNLYHTMTETIQQLSSDLGVLQHYGPTPMERRRMVNKTIAKLITDPADRAKFIKEVDTQAEVEAFKRSINRATRPSDNIYSKTVDALTTFEYVTKMGNAVLSAVGDIAMYPFLARSMGGKTAAEEAADLITQMAKMLGSTEARNKTLQDVGLFFDQVRAGLLEQYGLLKNQQPGMVGKFVKGYANATLLPRWVESVRAASAAVWSRRLGEFAGMKFDELDVLLKNGLNRYGIDADMWEIMRKGTRDGYLNKESIMDLPDEVFAPLAEKRFGIANASYIAKVKLDTRLKFGSMLNNLSMMSSTTPDARQMMFVTKLFGSPHSPMAKLMTQFLSATASQYGAITRIYASSANAPTHYTSMKGDMWGVTQLMTMSYFTYVASTWAKQLARGQEPQDPTTPEFILTAAARSGALHVFGDIALTTAMATSGYGARDAFKGNITGPVIEDLSRIWGAGKTAMSGDRKSGKERFGPLGKQALSMIPGGNLFYIQGGLNYLAINGAKEYLDHGFLRSVEQSTAKSPGIINKRRGYLFFRPTDSVRFDR